MSVASADRDRPARRPRRQPWYGSGRSASGSAAEESSSALPGAAAARSRETRARRGCEPPWPSCRSPARPPARRRPQCAQLVDALQEQQDLGSRRGHDAGQPLRAVLRPLARQPGILDHDGRGLRGVPRSQQRGELGRVRRRWDDDEREVRLPSDEVLIAGFVTSPAVRLSPNARNFVRDRRGTG